VSVSVITTAYNAEATIRATVRSILDQDVEDFEYVVVDDGSSDGTAAALEEFDDDRIRVIRLPERAGRARALNAALAAANRDFLANIDADDVSFPGRLTHQLKMLDADPTLGLVGGAYVTLELEGDAWIVRPPSSHEAIVACFATHFPICHSAVTYRRTALAEAGGFNPRHRSRIDFDAWIRILAGGWHVQQTPEIVTVHTKSPTSHFAQEYSVGRSAVELFNRNLRAIHDLDLGLLAYGKALARLGYSLTGRRSVARRRLYGTAPDPALLAEAVELTGRRGA
jgi:glycosyltransferase involved in cell wall biosynthesis